MDIDLKYYFSPFHNIYQNLCLEDYFLRHSDQEFCFFYVNDPCVVLGNFQNPWQETRLSKLFNDEITLARRQSGGGCVYHDRGNLNFCFYKNKKILSGRDKEDHLNLFRDLLSSKKIQTDKLPKSGMVYVDNETRFKFSGEAFKQTSSRSFHHGTLLIDSDLSQLNECLIPQFKKVETKAVASNRHLVGNLSNLWRGLTPESFIKEFTAFYNAHLIQVDYSLIHKYILDHADSLAEEEYVLGKTPKFKVSIKGREYLIEKAQVCSIDGESVIKSRFKPDQY